MSDTFSCLDVCTALMQRASNSKLSWIWISGLICPPFSYPFLIGILNHRGLFWFGQVFGAEIIEITYGHSLSKTHTMPFTHCVLDGWWFDLMIWQKNLQRHFSFYRVCSGPKKLIKWQNFKTTLCDLTKKLLPTIFVSAHKSSNWSGGQIHGWILLNKNIYYINFYPILCRFCTFHSEWFALTKMLLI